jgi:hypothetical protein
MLLTRIFFNKIFFVQFSKQQNPEFSTRILFHKNKCDIYLGQNPTRIQKCQFQKHKNKLCIYFFSTGVFDPDNIFNTFIVEIYKFIINLSLKFHRRVIYLSLYSSEFKTYFKNYEHYPRARRNFLI